MRFSSIQSPKSNTPCNLSSLLEAKPKSKISTFVASPMKQVLKFDNIEESLQMLKISVKKESDRRLKLKKLLQKYNQIYFQQKKHVKQIKSAIIEMKDAHAATKFKILVDPTLLVDNQIKVENRQFLCTLMNTFYETYYQNNNNSKVITDLSNQMSFLIKDISYNQDMLFLQQKNQINEQVQLEGQLLTVKNNLKDLIQKQKEVKALHSSVAELYDDRKQKHEQKIKMTNKLREELSEFQNKVNLLNSKISQKQAIKAQCLGKVDTQMMYQSKLNDQFELINKEISIKKHEQKRMLKQLIQGKIKEAQMKLNQKNPTKKRNRTIGDQARIKLKSEIQLELKHIRN